MILYYVVSGGPTNARSSQFADVRRCFRSSKFINRLCASKFEGVRGQPDFLLVLFGQKGLTQEQVASRLGKPQSYIPKYESRERRLDVIELLDIAAALEVSPTTLIRDL